MKIAKYAHFLGWLQYVLDCIHSARQTAVDKLESYHRGVFPQELVHLRRENDVPKEIQGVCPACAETTTISAENGRVYVKGVLHNTCTPFGNALLEDLKATRVVRVVKEKLGVPSSIDLRSLGVFLNSATLEEQSASEWHAISLEAIARCLKCATAALAGSTPSFLDIQCPLCKQPAQLFRNGAVSAHQQGENEHTGCKVPNRFDELRLSLTSDDKAVPKSRQNAEKSISQSTLSQDDRTAILNAMIQHPNARFKTIASFACAASGVTHLTQDDVDSVNQDLGARIELSQVEKDALQSRKMKRRKLF